MATYSNGLPHVVTDALGGTATYTYDGLQRPTEVDYSDGTSETWTYTASIAGNSSESLNVGTYTDRLDHITTYTYDGDGRPLTATDAAGRQIQYGWCGCGALTSFTDGGNNTTTWTYDQESRVLSKTIPTGSANNTWTYTYDPDLGRLASYSAPNDGSNATATYGYNLDNTVANVTYGGSAHPANLTFTYDSIFPRVVTMTDGFGTTTYTYGAVTSGSTESNRLTDVKGPWSNSTIQYAHDALGRFLSRSVVSDDGNTTFQTETYTYDPMNRMLTIGGNMGTANLTYNDPSLQLADFKYPNGMNTTFSYYGTTAGEWLQTITNRAAPGNTSAALLSRFDYSHRGDGSIATWQEQFGWAANVTGNLTPTQRQLYNFTYDNSGWLTEAKLGSPSGNSTSSLSGAIWQDSLYTYDGAGNRLSVNVNSANLTGNYNAANQLTSQSRTGDTRLFGYTDEPAIVTLKTDNLTVTPRAWSLPGGKPWAFDASFSLATGNSNVTITAVPSSSPYGTTTTHTWDVVSGGTAANFTYDANGGMLSCVTNPGASGNLSTSANYTWDGLGRLTKIVTGNTTISFGYDGLGHRVSLSANISGNITNEYYLWDGDKIVQKRLSGNSSANITAKYYSYGYQTISGANATNYFYSLDHLGSVREVVANDGQTVEGRYSYGPWGETTYLDYSNNTVTQPQFGYAGYFQTPYVPNNYFTFYRIYQPNLGRWLSRDPIGLAGGVNVYGYVTNTPVNLVDDEGLDPPIGMFGVSFDNESSFELSAQQQLQPGPSGQLSGAAMTAIGTMQVCEGTVEINDGSATFAGGIATVETGVGIGAIIGGLGVALFGVFEVQDGVENMGVGAQRQMQGK